MNYELQKKCDLLIDNRKLVTEAFKWESEHMNLAAASLFACKGKEVSADALKECEAVLKENTKWFSEFRGMIRVPLVCYMSLAENPKQYFDNFARVYELLKQNKWMCNEYKMIASLTICEHAKPDDFEKAVNRTLELYAKMKENHRWITSDEDLPFAAMLAVSDMEVDALVDEMEKDFGILKEKFHDKDAIQSLSHVLALDTQPADAKCRKVFEIFDGLKASKHKFGTGHELASLGCLASLEMSGSTIAGLIAEVDDYLKSHKGFSNWSVAETERRTYASTLVMSQYDNGANTALSTGGVLIGNAYAITVAIELCMIACICCVNVATVSN